MDDAGTIVGVECMETATGTLVRRIGILRQEPDVSRFAWGIARQMFLDAIVIDYEEHVVMHCDTFGATVGQHLVPRRFTRGGNVVGSDTDDEDHEDDGHVDLPDAKGTGRVSRGISPEFGLEFVSKPRHVRMPRMDVVQMTREVLRLHGDVANWTAFRVRHRSGPLTEVKRRSGYYLGLTWTRAERSIHHAGRDAGSGGPYPEPPGRTRAPA